MITDTELRKRIRRGIALLDKEQGRKIWKPKIRLQRLNLSSVLDCPLGQTDNGYENHRNRLGLSNKKAIRYGFFLLVESWHWAWSRLTALWKEELRQRGCK